MRMRGEQEQLDTWQGDVLPGADGTWYLQVALDVFAWGGSWPEMPSEAQ